MKTAFLQENNSNIKHHKKKKSMSLQGKPSKISKLKNVKMGKKINILNTEYDTHINLNMDTANTVNRNLFFSDVYVDNENRKELKSNAYINYDIDKHKNIDNSEYLKKIDFQLKAENNLLDELSSFNLKNKHCKSEPLVPEMCEDSSRNMEWNNDTNEDFEFVIVDNIDLLHRKIPDDVHEANEKDLSEIISDHDCLVALKHDDRRNVIKNKKRSDVVEKTAKLLNEVKSNNQTDLSDIVENSKSNLIESQINSIEMRKKSIRIEGLCEKVRENNEKYFLDDGENDQCNLIKTPENDKSSKKKNRKKALTQLEENKEQDLIDVGKNDQYNLMETPENDKSSKKKNRKKALAQLEENKEQDLIDVGKNDQFNLMETPENDKSSKKKDRKKALAQLEEKKEHDLIDVGKNDQYNLMETPERNKSAKKKDRKKSLRKLEENFENDLGNISGNGQFIFMKTPENTKSIKKKDRKKALMQLENNEKELSEINRNDQSNLIETPNYNKLAIKKNRKKTGEHNEEILIKISRRDRFHLMETPEVDESTKKKGFGHYEEMMNNFEESIEENVSDIDKNEQLNFVPSEKSNNSKEDLNEVVIEHSNMNDIDDQRDISDITFRYNQFQQTQSPKRNEKINVDFAELNDDSISIIEDNANGWQQVLSCDADIDDEGELKYIIGRYKEFSMTQSNSNSINMLNIKEISDDNASKLTTEIVDNEDLRKEVIFESTLGYENDNKLDVDGIGSKEPSADVMDINCNFIIIEPEKNTKQEITKVNNNDEVQDHIEDDASLFSDCSSNNSLEIETQNTEYKNNDDDVISLICNQELEKEIMNKKILDKETMNKKKLNINKPDIIQTESFDRSDKEVFFDSTKEVEVTITQTENIDNILQFDVNSSCIEETANKEFSLDNLEPKETVPKSNDKIPSILDDNHLKTTIISSDATISNTYEIITLSPSILSEELEKDENHNVNLDEQITTVLDDIMSSVLFRQVESPINSKSKKVTDSLTKTPVGSSVRKRRLSQSTMEPSNKKSKLNKQVNQSLNKSVLKDLPEDTTNFDLFNEMKMNFEKGILLSDGLVICPASLLNGNFLTFDANDLTSILRIYDKEISEQLTNRADILNRCLLKLSQSNVIRAAYFSELQKCVFLKYDSLPEDTLKKYGINGYKYDKALWNYNIKQKICRDLISIKTPTTLEELLQTELEYLSLMSDP